MELILFLLASLVVSVVVVAICCRLLEKSEKRLGIAMLINGLIIPLIVGLGFLAFSANASIEGGRGIYLYLIVVGMIVWAPFAALSTVIVYGPISSHFERNRDREIEK